MTINRLVLEWEERIKLHLEREMKFDQCKSKNFKSKHPGLVKVKGEMDDEGEVTETPKVLMQAWDKFLEIKHACKEKKHQSEENLPTSSYDDDDDEYSFVTQEYLMTCSTAITPDSPKTDSLIMEDEHLDTIPETESDEFIKYSVEDLVPIPSESEDEQDDNNYYIFRVRFNFMLINPDSARFKPLMWWKTSPWKCLIFCPTHPALQLDFTSFLMTRISFLNVFSPSGDRNKICDPGICIEVESTRILAPLSPVIDTLLPFSSENEDKVFNHDVLAYKEKSPPSSSHRGLKPFQLSPEIPMMIHGDNTPNLGVCHPHFYPP
ncbi:hypothetical protein Tco_0218519 [Tanacetum coccineum]